MGCRAGSAEPKVRAGFKLIPDIGSSKVMQRNTSAPAKSPVSRAALLFDTTSTYFETEREGGFRASGNSKDHRPDPRSAAGGRRDGRHQAGDHGRPRQRV